MTSTAGRPGVLVGTSMRTHAVINLTAALIRTGAAVVSTPLTIRLCGADEFGRWAFLLSIATILTSLDFGLPTTLNLYLAHAPAAESSRTASRIAYATVCAALVSLAIGVVAAVLVLGAPHVAVGHRFIAAGLDVPLAASIAVFVGTRIWGNAAAAFLQARMRYVAANVIGLLFVIVVGVAVPWSAALGHGARTFMEINAVASALACVAYGSALRAEIGPLRALWLKTHEWTEMVRFGMTIWLGTAGGLLFSQFDRVVVGFVLGAHELGLYAAATQVSSQINALSAIPVQPLLPHLASRLDGPRRQEDAAGLLTSALRINTAMALGLSGLIVVYAPVVSSIIIANGDARAMTTCLRILATVYGVYSLNAVGFYVLFAIRRAGRLTVITIGSGLLTLITIAVAAREGGLTGAALGNATFVLTLLLTWTALRAFQVSLKVWFALVRLPLCLWAGLIAVSSGLDLEGLVPVTAVAAIFLLSIAAWVVWPGRGGRPVWATERLGTP